MNELGSLGEADGAVPRADLAAVQMGASTEIRSAAAVNIRAGKIVRNQGLLRPGAASVPLLRGRDQSRPYGERPPANQAGRVPGDCRRRRGSEAACDWADHGPSLSA